MAWKAIDRQAPAYDPQAPPLIRETLQQKIRGLFQRYETKRAALLPALQMTQDTLGHISHQAMVEIAQLLDMHPSQVIDTLSFYTHFWTHPRGQKVVMVCRSLTCQLMGANEVLDQCKKHLGIDEHQTTQNQNYSLVTEECLAGCEHAPCMLIGEKLHKKVNPDQVAKILADKDNAKIEFPRSNLFDGVNQNGHPTQGESS